MSDGVSLSVLRCRASFAGTLCLINASRLRRGTDKSTAYIRINQKLAADRFRLALAEYLDEKAGFRDDQPRWPAGSGEESGRWSGGAGSGTEAGSTSEPRGGHHFVPREIITDEKIGLSSEAKRVFERGVTGPLRNDFHGWNEEHKLYNNAVRESLSKFLIERSISPGQMTAEQANEFLKMTRGSADPRIGGYNMKIYWREIMYYFKRGPGFKGEED